MSPRLALFLFLSTLLTSAGRAQVLSPMNRPLALSGYFTASAAQPELGQGHALGYSGGLVLERSRLAALDFRGVVLRDRIVLHTYIAEMGPRFSPSVSRRFQPYGGVMGGYGHSGYANPHYTGLGRGYGLVWTVDAGLDAHLKWGLDWRVADYSYNHIYAGSGASPTILSTGISYRMPTLRSHGPVM